MIAPILLLFIDWSQWRPENLFGGQVLERTPAGLSIVYIVSVGVLIVFLFLTLLENFRRSKYVFERDLPAAVSRKLTTAVANRSLQVWQVVFIAVAFAVFGFQVYWTYFADESNEQFQALAYKDLRTRRTTAASLRGWMLERSVKLPNAHSYYRLDKNGDIERGFALEREMAHLLGTERGTPRLERTTYKRQADPKREAGEGRTLIKIPRDKQKD